MKKLWGGLLAVAAGFGLAMLEIPGELPLGNHGRSAWLYERPTLISTHDYASAIDELRAEIAREKRSLRDAIRSPLVTHPASQLTAEPPADAATNPPADPAIESPAEASIASSANRSVETDSQSVGSADDNVPTEETLVPAAVSETPSSDFDSQQLNPVDHRRDAYSTEPVQLMQPPTVQLKTESPYRDRAALEVADESPSQVVERIGPSANRQTPAHFDEQREPRLEHHAAPRTTAARTAEHSFDSPLGSHDEQTRPPTGDDAFRADLSFPGLSRAAISGREPAQPAELGDTFQDPGHVEQDTAPSVSGPSATGNLWSVPGEDDTADDAAFGDGPRYADWSIAPAAGDGEDDSGAPVAVASIAETADRAVTVLWQAPEAINLGQELDCQLLVTNGGDAPALGVEICVDLPPDVVLLRCDPRADTENRVLVWRLGKLMPAESKRIRLAIQPQQPGRIEPAVAVKSTSTTYAQIDVLEPKLELTVAGPEQVTIGQAFSYQFHISNSGSGSATGVALHLRMDSILQPLSNGRMQFVVGTLAPGQTRRIELFISARESGHAQMAIAVTCDAQSTAERARTIEIVRPQLQLAVDGPSRRFIDRKANYVITVHNPGLAPAENVQIFDRIPDGFRFHKASSGGNYDRALRQVGWFVGRLEPNETTQVGVQLIATEAGEHQHAAVVNADAGASDMAHTVTRVEGVAAVALEVVDSLDPIEIGGETTYEIRLRNQGTGPARQLQLAAELPDEMEILSARGPTRQHIERNRLIFEPLDTLQPDEAVVYKVRVRSRAAGSARFRAYLRSAEEPEAVLEEERTRVYDE